MVAKTVGIVARLDRRDALALALNISKRFESAGFNVLFESNLAEQIDRKELAKPLEEMLSLIHI